MGPRIGGQTGIFMIYLDGKDLIGSAEVKLPEVKQKTSTIGGAGIMGEIEFTNPFSIESMEVEFKFNTITDRTFDLIGMSGKLIEMKSKVIERDPITHAQVTSDLRVNMKGNHKSVDLGTIKIDEVLNTSFKMEATYLEVFRNGKQIFKVDKLNAIFELLGKSIISKLSDML